MPTLDVNSEAMTSRLRAALRVYLMFSGPANFIQFVVSLERDFLGNPMVVDRENDKLKFVGLW